jgi:peptide/nickel transport system substrate-binding protein
MQKILYEQAPYILTFYYDNLEAYRSDRFTGFLPQPDPDGSLLFQYGTHSYRNIRPVSADDSGSGGAAGSPDEGGTSPGLVVAGAAVGIAVLGAAGLLFVRSRRRPEQDVE